MARKGKEVVAKRCDFPQVTVHQALILHEKGDDAHYRILTGGVEITVEKEERNENGSIEERIVKLTPKTEVVVILYILRLQPTDKYQHILYVYYRPEWFEMFID